MDTNTDPATGLGYIGNTTINSDSPLPIVQDEDNGIFLKTSELTFTTNGADADNTYWQVDPDSESTLYFNFDYNDERPLADQMRIVFAQIEDTQAQNYYKILPLHFLYSDSVDAYEAMLSTNDNETITISNEDTGIRFDINPYPNGLGANVEATNGVQTDVAEEKTKCMAWFWNPIVKKPNEICKIELTAQQPPFQKFKLSTSCKYFHVHRRRQHGNFIAISLREPGCQNYYLQHKSKSKDDHELVFKPYDRCDKPRKPPMYLYTRRFALGETQDVFYLSTSSGKTSKIRKESKLKDGNDDGDEYVVYVDTTNPRDARIKLSQKECTFFCMSIYVYVIYVLSAFAMPHGIATLYSILH